ncbi:MAG: hypothetical protein ACI8Q9_001057 [Planctomycetota bacterium]|jgi:hypothetical protein
MSPSVNHRRAKLRALPGLLLAKTLSGLAFWAPVVLATGFLALVAFNGLTPALKEQRRLERRSAQMDQVSEQLIQEEASLERVLKAQADPMYIERLRRLKTTRADEAPVADTDNRLLDHLEGRTL